MPPRERLALRLLERKRAQDPLWKEEVRKQSALLSQFQAELGVTEALFTSFLWHAALNTTVNTIEGLRAEWKRWYGEGR